MDEQKTKIFWNGQLRDAVRIPVRSAHEAWSEYILDDGTVVRMKVVITDVFRISDVYDQDGSPIYQIKSGNIASAIPPEQLKRIPQEG